MLDLLYRNPLQAKETIIQMFSPQKFGNCGINYPQLGFTRNCRWWEEQGTKQCELLRSTAVFVGIETYLEGSWGLIKTKTGQCVAKSYLPVINRSFSSRPSAMGNYIWICAAPAPLRLMASMASIAYLGHTPKLELFLFGKKDIPKSRFPI